jgi:hypothetical protein
MSEVLMSLAEVQKSEIEVLENIYLNDMTFI